MTISTLFCPTSLLLPSYFYRKHSVLSIYRLGLGVTLAINGPVTTLFNEVATLLDAPSIWAVINPRRAGAASVTVVVLCVCVSVCVCL